jgi:hypothetical protein
MLVPLAPCGARESDRLETGTALALASASACECSSPNVIDAGTRESLTSGVLLVAAYE